MIRLLLVISLILISFQTPAKGESNIDVIEVTSPAANATAFIERLYVNILGRNSDANGMQYWLDVMQTQSAARIVFGFFNSSEFTSFNINDSTFVNIIYQTLFDRPADTNGFQYWSELLEQGTLREFVLYGFIFSNEFDTLTQNFGVPAFNEQDIKIYKVKSFVRRFYNLLLNREADLEGLYFWTDQVLNGLQSAFDVAHNFFFSNEFTQRSNILNQTFIELVYHVILDREPDAAGIAYWSEQLANGMSREEMLDRFMLSQEFSTLAENYGILVTLTQERLNTVVILTDDQRWDSIQYMPILLDKIASRGITFESAFVSTPLCGPVRANILSGGFYSYNTGLIMNPGDNGGEDKFRGQDENTIATALQQAGYKTMLAGGKYLNGYVAPYIPPGWTRFVTNTKGPASSDWFEYDAVSGSSDSTSSTGTIEHITQYVTDYHRDQVLDFLDGVGDSDFFIYFSLFAPHVKATPAVQDEQLFSDFLYRDRAHGEVDLSDKPDWVSDPTRFVVHKTERDEFQRNQLRSLQSVDRAIGAIVDKIEEIGELDRTVFIFTSDNGYLWGEHGLHTKGMAYDESIRVPFIIVYPGVAPGSNNSLISVDLDIGATLFDLAHVNKPSDGRSLIPLLIDPDATTRDELYFQHWGGHEGPFGTWSAIRTDNWKLIENAYGEVELYDLIADPYEEESQHDNPDLFSIRNELAFKLAQQRGLGLRTFDAPSGSIGQSYNYRLETWGGQGPYTWMIEAGVLPDGLWLDSATGVVSGIPNTVGTFEVTISVEDSSIARHSGQAQRIVGPGKGMGKNIYTFIINP